MEQIQRSKRWSGLSTKHVKALLLGSSIETRIANLWGSKLRKVLTLELFFTTMEHMYSVQTKSNQRIQVLSNDFFFRPELMLLCLTLIVLPGNFIFNGTSRSTWRTLYEMTKKDNHLRKNLCNLFPPISFFSKGKNYTCLVWNTFQFPLVDCGQWKGAHLKVPCNKHHFTAFDIWSCLVINDSIVSDKYGATQRCT